ncbi:MAG: pyridoxamine 5'-phosphate oxidase family protein [Candidatus Bathyarchaeota archaeon]|nr:pyridoxamine 5'-phosphate oxidase family protein [Candidatus Bathyarchaeota archaeon]
MDFEECLKFANQNPASFFATVDQTGHPRVRGLLMWYADKTGFYFQIGAMKDLYKQLQQNPNVEVCFFNNKLEGGIMLRVAGQIEFLDDTELKRKAIQDRKFLQTWGFTPESPDLIIFRIPKGQAHTWTMKTNFEPKKIINFG